jgi:hypothetical protein
MSRSGIQDECNFLLHRRGGFSVRFISISSSNRCENRAASPQEVKVKQRLLKTNVAVLEMRPRKTEDKCFQCGHLCLELSQICDGIVDCVSSEDESHCQLGIKISVSRYLQ